MYLLKSACIAFSMFSKLPMPQFDWEEKQMKYMLLFFPLVGVVIGGISYGWGWFCVAFEVNTMCAALIGAAIPLLLTGGIHVDGYMDTMDALHSYQPAANKLEILKDPHIGAFSVIQLLGYYLIYVAAYSELTGKTAFFLVGMGFWLVRICSAIGVVSFPRARQDGLVSLFAGQADVKRVRLGLWVQLVLCSALLLLMAKGAGAAVLAASIGILGYYRRQCGREFGGVTGDTAGYFTVLGEGAIAVIAAAGCILHWI